MRSERVSSTFFAIMRLRLRAPLFSRCACSATVRATDFAMLLRVLLQFFVDVTTNKLYAFCVMLTEPIIFPFRLLFAKLHIGEGLPIDIPFFAGYLALTLITLFLPVI